MTELTEKETAWLAGILEGEGCFFFGSSGYPRITVEMSDKDIIERIAKLMGHSVRESRKADANKKATWATSLSGKKTIPVLNAILPYMGQRRTEAIRQLLHPDPAVIQERRRIHRERATRYRAYLRSMGITPGSRAKDLCACGARKCVVASTCSQCYQKTRKVA